jgi:hypothetical protein
MDSDIVYKFVQERCVETDNRRLWIATDILFAHFKAWVKTQEVLDYHTKHKFTKAMLHLRFYIWDAGMINKKRIRKYQGLTLIA